jgi:outer membrane protein TolC
VKTLKQLIAAGLCATCTGVLWAQDIAPAPSPGGFILKSYEAAPIPPARLANSGRLGALVRGNKMYLTAQDAIALALENNVDIESNRYNALTSLSNLRRQQAGGALPGVPSGATQVGAGASGQGVSGSQSAAGVSSSGGSGGSTNAVNATVTQIGSTTPTLDPIFSDAQNYLHLSNPQANSTQSQTINLVQNYRTYSESLSQGLITGGQVSLSYSDSYLNENAPTDVLNPSSSASLGISFQHYLLQGLGRALNARNITVAKVNLKVTDLNFRQEVISVVVSVLNSYYGLSADYEDVKAKQSALNVAQRFFEDNKKQVQIGTLAPLDVTTAESQVASSEEALVVSQTTLEQDQLTLKNLLSRNGLADPILRRVDIIPLDHISVPEKDDLPPVKQLVQTALANRPDLAADKLNLQNSITSALNTTNAVLPTLVVFGSASNAGLSGAPRIVPVSGATGLGNTSGTTTLPSGFINCPAGVGTKGSICEVPDPTLVGGIGNALGQIADRHFPSESGGAFFGATIRDRSAIADQVIDQLSIRQQALENARSSNQVLVDVSNQSIGLQQARIRYQAAIKNRVLEEQLLSAEQKKFALGASTTYTVVQQERDLATAQSTEVAALVTYSQARVSLDQTLGTTLQSNHISIEEATSGKVSRASSLPAALPADQPQ